MAAARKALPLWTDKNGAYVKLAGLILCHGANLPPEAQVVLTHKTISRKHMTIRVEEVAHGDGVRTNMRRDGHLPRQ